MLHYKTIHPRSWSEIARFRADRMIESSEFEIHAGRSTKEEAQKWMLRKMGNSVYTSNIWTKRAAKRLHRKGWL